MKHTHLLYIILALFICIGILAAQTPKWVSTEVQRRAAVLEYFTNILGADFAKGHKIANELSQKYTVFLPDSIKNIPLDIRAHGNLNQTNLETVAFVAESDSIIYTGHNFVIEIPENIRTDLHIEDVTEYPFRFGTIHPKIKVTNNSDVPVTKFDIEYILENNKTLLHGFNIIQISKIPICDTIVSKIAAYSGVLNKGESAILELPEITRTDLKISSVYSAYSSVYNIYSNDEILTDIDSTNNTTKTTNIGLIDTAFSETEINFEIPDTSSAVGTLPAHTVLDNSLNTYFAVKETNGANNTNYAVLFLLRNLYNVASMPGYIMFGEVDCHDNPNKILSFYYAFSYGYLNGTTPQIVVEISKDWGKTWQTISKIFCQETGKISGTNEFYIPTSDEYKQVQIDLSEYVKENFIMRIGGIPGSNGSTLWIDEISIKNAPEESIVENTKLSIYPNPASNILHINNDNLLGAEYEIYDISGKLIIKDINNTKTINIETLSTGSYSLKIIDSIFNFIKK